VRPVNPEANDDEAGAGRPAPGQRASTRRAAAPRRPVTAEQTSAEPASAEPTAAGSPSTSLASTPGNGLPAVPMPADPPTTELRGAVADDVEPAFVAPIAAPTRPIVAQTTPDGRPVAGPLPTNIYRARRPGVAVLLIIPAVAVGVVLVRALAIAAFGDQFDLAGVIASVCALVSLPFLVAGMYGLVSGAAHGAEHYGFKIWARPPLAYLLVGLAFVAAAGLAIT